MSKAEQRNRPPVGPSDDGIPAGDSPPKPRWPLVLAAVAWGTWMVFLIVMLVFRLRESARG
jgi:hypothetical protein